MCFYWSLFRGCWIQVSTPLVMSTEGMMLQRNPSRWIHLLMEVRGALGLKLDSPMTTVLILFGDRVRRWFAVSRVHPRIAVLMNLRAPGGFSWGLSPPCDECVQGRLGRIPCQ